MYDLQCATLKFIAQKFYQAFVFFDRKKTRAFGQRNFRQRAETRADLNDEIFSTDLRLIDNPLREIAIM